MAELLSHVLFAYALFTVASWRLEWLSKRWVPVAVVGAILPDLNRIGLLLGEPTIEAALGVPFSFDAIHTFGGVLVLSGIGAIAFDRRRLLAYGILVAGALSHLLVDALKLYADGSAAAWLYPVTWYRHPSPNLYVSSDSGVLAVAGVLALSVWLIDRYRVDTTKQSP
ncbi:metal-dependent hydrolase [Halostagnicola sp. A-GB9-2]|uniref:metal-dependent hydrolase n=1 Tax=Halostagnicola sp. A-GB9-2 TaxID=3048066 RepID=UPI0024BF4033|nr:metal-dependent hydrolase [Halostagnicola sp. A-GB9-2]MDJ1430841.1 metal-dependent hydrolase [Halostagnicola sp. A-GB9-2]